MFVDTKSMKELIFLSIFFSVQCLDMCATVYGIFKQMKKCQVSNNGICVLVILTKLYSFQQISNLVYEIPN